MWEIRLLGALAVRRDGRRMPPFTTRIARSLFGFLVLHRGRRFPRLVLAEQLWSEIDESTARKRLRMELWRIRKTLDEGSEPAEPVPLVADRDEVGFVPTDRVWLDLDQLEDRLEQAGERGRELTPQQVEALQESALLYRGDLLEGEYGDWCAVAREQLRERFLRGQRRLFRHYRQRRDWESAITVGLGMLEVDGLLEEVYQGLMVCYWSAGNRAAALQTFERCSRRLRSELKVEPLAETSALHRRIRRETGPPVESVQSLGAPSSGSPPEQPNSSAARNGEDCLPGDSEVTQVVRDLESLATLLDRAGDQVRRALQLIYENS